MASLSATADIEVLPENEFQTRPIPRHRSRWRPGQNHGYPGDRGRDLNRYAYVATEHRSKGLGGILLDHLLHETKGPILLGTWAAATWAIRPKAIPATAKKRTTGR